jgi:hypothetical protein
MLKVRTEHFEYLIATPFRAVILNLKPEVFGDSNYMCNS